MEKERNVVFIDTGGTFSDTIILKENGEFITGKASTTPDNLAEGFFASLEAACRNMGKKTSKEVLPATVGIGYGTTQGTNILVTRANAPKIGFITTRGAEDRTNIMRFRGTGLSRAERTYSGFHFVSPLTIN